MVAEDTRKITYHLDRSPSGTGYRIGSTRHRGVPICVIGRPEVPRARLANGEWYRPPELEAWRGLIGKTGSPPKLHAVLHDEQRIIHLIGYESDAEFLRAASSLQRVTAD